MHSFTTVATAAFAAIAAIPAVSAHGFVQTVTAAGKVYPGGDPGWFYQPDSLPESVGWYAENQDNGFVEPNNYSSPDIICHKGAKPGNSFATAKAGSTIDLRWNTWPDSHHGPIINSLARANGPWKKIKKERLSWFKIQQDGLVDGSAAPGTWATDEMMANNLTYSVKLPDNIQGNFVLRHEIVALHSAGQEDGNGAQNYPQCINVKITPANGNVYPCNSGAPCSKGVKLYKKKDFMVNIYTALGSYKIPGKAVWGKAAKRVASMFKA